MKLPHWLFLFLLVALSAWFVVDGVGDSGEVGTGLEQVESEGVSDSGAVVDSELMGDGVVDSEISEALRAPGEVVASREALGDGAVLVCTGTILMPDGNVLPDGAAVVAYGNVWPDGEESQRASVGPGGEFRVTFAPGTYRGFMKLEAPGWKLSAYGVWRNWFEEP
ncbi:MAG: hypothetical protein JKY61_08050, partial [Planctomycetes bacterium]|nr:hypothetical protein [Planctomycetota bacterium]